MRHVPRPLAARASRRPPPEHGATSVEYGLLIGLIAAATVIAVMLFGGSVAGLFADTESAICNERPGGCAPAP